MERNQFEKGNKIFESSAEITVNWEENKIEKTEGNFDWPALNASEKSTPMHRNSDFNADLKKSKECKNMIWSFKNFYNCTQKK